MVGEIWECGRIEEAGIKGLGWEECRKVEGVGG